MIGGIPALIFGIGAIIYSFILRYKNPDYRFLPISYFSLGFVFSGFSIVYLLDFEPMIGVIVFFGGMLSILLYSIIFRKQIKKENVDLMVNKLKKIDSGEKIKVLDFFIGKFVYKLLLKKGVKYTAKTRTVVLGIGVSIPMILFQQFYGYYSTCFLLIYFLVYFSLFSIIGYHISKNIYEDVYNEYHQKYSDDEFYSDSFDLKQ